jgi:hypothetical protein
VQPPRSIFPREARFRTEGEDPARAGLFEPLFRSLGDRMARLRRLQAGRLNLQLLYTLVTLVAVLAFATVRMRLR